MKHFLNITCIYFELLQCFHPGTMKQSKQILHMHITIEIWKDVLYSRNGLQNRQDQLMCRTVN